VAVACQIRTGNIQENATADTFLSHERFLMPS